MKASTIKYGVLTFTLSLVTIIFALMPFHAFLTVWGSTLFGHYTVLRLWKEALVVIAALGVVYLYCFDRKVRFHTFRRKLTWLIFAYAAVQVVWALVAWHAGSVSLKAAAYGVLLNLRFLGFFLLTWALAVRTGRMERRWPRLLLWPAVVVAVFGLLEVFVLPVDFLRHFGYGPHTIMPYETINHNMNFIRYMSTLRGANPLGAYLLVPISALVVLLVRFPHSWNWAKGLALAAMVAMEFFSFSRSAWIGMVLSIVFIIAVSLSRNWWSRFGPWFAAAAIVVIVLLGGAFVALRHNVHFQNTVFHTQDHSAVASTSDQGHASALKDGVHDVLTEPLGRGPGTAGPASVYNTQEPTRISENYYLQVGQETGLLGLALFVVIACAVAYVLWSRRAAPLSLTLLAALIGVSFVGLLSHVWTDDTLAYVWWGLAGIAIGTPLVKKDKP